MKNSCLSRASDDCRHWVKSRKLSIGILPGKGLTLYATFLTHTKKKKNPPLALTARCFMKTQSISMCFKTTALSSLFKSYHGDIPFTHLQTYVLIPLKLFTERQNFELVKIKSICRRQNKFDFNSEIRFFGKGRKHSGKRRKCWLLAFSPFPTMFLKGIFPMSLKVGILW